jgi:hypothetical protein
MSKGNVRKFRKNDYSDEQESIKETHNFDKRKEKRMDRALRTKDISVLIEDEEDYEDIWFHGDKW